MPSESRLLTVQALSLLSRVILSFLEHIGATADDWQDIITVINYVLDVK